MNTPRRRLLLFLLGEIFAYSGRAEVHLPTILSTSGISRPQKRENVHGTFHIVDGLSFYDGFSMFQQYGPENGGKFVRLGSGASYTIVGWLRTKQGGPIIAKTTCTDDMPTEPKDKGVASILYVARGHLYYSHFLESGVAEVNIESDKASLQDGSWHHIAVTSGGSGEHIGSVVSLFVDGQLISAQRVELPQARKDRNCLRVGYGTEQFPKTLWGENNKEGDNDLARKITGRQVFAGQLADVQYWRGASSAQEIRALQAQDTPTVPEALNLPRYTHLSLNNPQVSRDQISAAEHPSALRQISDTVDRASAVLLQASNTVEHHQHS